MGEAGQEIQRQSDRRWTKWGEAHTYDFKAHRDDIVATLNELGKAVVDMGLTPVLHQHTGTCVETREETYAALEAVDTRVMKFGPDIGQLQKGGSDRVQVVKDFLPSGPTHASKGLLGRTRTILGIARSAKVKSIFQLFSP